MRLLSLLLIACSSGCSAIIADSGFEMRGVTSQAKARTEFGFPEKTERVDGQLVEHYRTRRKLREHGKTMTVGTLGAMSLGASEIVFFPYELYLLGTRSIWGQDFQIHYASDGSINHIFLEANGDFVFDGVGKIEPDRHVSMDPKGESL